jgi:hypothetical protein
MRRAPGEIGGNIENPIEAFDGYFNEQLSRLAEAQRALNEAMPIVTNLDVCNERFAQLGRDDLYITTPVEMMPVAHPEEIEDNCNNFIPNFHFYKGFIITKDKWDDDVRTPVAVTQEEVVGLIDSSFTFDDTRLMNHSTKPAFIRMLALFPDFTTKLVTEMSKPENRHEVSKFIPELFVAYQIMSRLVDTSDQNVVRDDVVDNWYLCR